MMIWIRGLLLRRGGRIAAAAIGVALAVGLLASLGSFLASSQATMTSRASRSVAVDWQVQTTAGASPAGVLATLTKAPGTRVALPVTFARVPQFTAAGGGTTQTTGAGVVLGLPDGYRTQFPGALRTLAGSDTGVLVAQQTAANLHVGVGSPLTVGLTGNRSVRVTVAGIVDLPAADSLFQRVGAPTQSQPIAPPDNVVLLPQRDFDTALAPLTATRPDLVTHQVHLARTHDLPPAPVAAYTQESGQARNAEVALAGAGLVGDNLGATLDAARKDALYANILFLFLGVPGAILAGLLTVAIASSGGTRRRREQALLRTRGASPTFAVRMALIEAGLVAAAGSVLGLAAAALASATLLHTPVAALTTTWPWAVAGVAAGAVTALAAVVLPVRRDLRDATVAAGRATVGRPEQPRWLRWRIDLILLASAAVTFWVTSRNGYALVLAPEGVASISVSYWAFLGPALLWIGGGMLIWRLTDLLLRRGRKPLTALLRPLAGTLSATVVASLSRQRILVARSVVLIALAVGFAFSTATFNATYQQQAEVDARLTNGADVTITQSPGAPAGPAESEAIATVPGVKAVEPLQHRYAYVGADLQDLYGVRPGTVTAATSLQDAYFGGGTATQLMGKLAARPDSILVSDETVKDYQLNLGDHLTLRLQNSATRKYSPVTFTYAGVVKEFPTAPTDSFLVANATYIAQQTADTAVGSFLIDTGGQNTAGVAAALQTKLGAAATVTDISGARARIGSSLTAVDLSGLTKVELAFALALAAAASGLIVSLGLTERRRTYALAAALGARTRQLAAFVIAEGALVLVVGLTLGAVTAAALSQMLIKVLTGVFDPPPAALAIPWSYLTTAGMLIIAATAAAVTLHIRTVQHSDLTELRKL